MSFFKMPIEVGKVKIQQLIDDLIVRGLPTDIERKLQEFSRLL